MPRLVCEVDETRHVSGVRLAKDGTNLRWREAATDAVVLLPKRQ
jgi:hypothetical protein